MLKIEVDEEKCCKCMLCVELCPTNAFSKRNGSLFIDNAKCIGCMGCIPLCPVKAIKATLVNDKLA